LRHLADVIAADCGVDVHTVPGGGAAGGFGAGVLAFLSGTLRSGIDTILDTVGFDALLSGTDLVITGEGRIDSQSVQGKALSGIATAARKQGKPVIALVGADDSTPDIYDMGITAVFSINRRAEDLAISRHKSRDNLAATMDNILRIWK
jgi:glycerate kinase